jgi:phytoene dehydrogenase-like protein
VGVVLVGGEEIRGGAVSSSLDPRTSLLRLPSAEEIGLDPAQRRRLEQWRSDGCSAKVNLALSRTPSFACRPEPGPHLAGGVSIAPSVEYLESAYQDAREGRCSRRPFLDLVIPSAIDPRMAPPGAAVVSCFVQYAPRHLAAGDWDETRSEALGDAVLEVLEEHAPGISESVVHRQVVTPADIERQVGIQGGNIFHGEIRLSQLFLNRPLAGTSEFRTLLPGYYLCGSGCHPGGGISGAPGRFAALRLGEDLATGRTVSAGEAER